jgi:glycine hydroxymethyltransferase
MILTNSEEIAKKINSAIFPGIQGGPLMHVIAAKAVAFGEALTDDFKAYAHRVVANARALAEGLVSRGIDIVSGGTDSHLMLVDLRSRKVTGMEAEAILGRAGITVNKNTIPGDPQSPFVTSGIRLGTPALTTRGMGTAEMTTIAAMIDRALSQPDDATLAAIRKETAALAEGFPLYPGNLAGAGAA